VLDAGGCTELSAQIEERWPDRTENSQRKEGAIGRAIGNMTSQGVKGPPRSV